MQYVVDTMVNEMGYDNCNGWLTAIADRCNGDISRVLDEADQDSLHKARLAD